MFTMTVNLIIACTLIKLIVASEICDAGVQPEAPASRQALDQTVQRTSPLYGLSAISNEYLIRTQCHEHLQLFRDGVRQKLPWALKMFDASASLEPGFTFGNNFWLGNIDVCNAVDQPLTPHMSSHLPHNMKVELLTSVAPFNVDFRIIYLRHNSSWQADPVVIAFATRVHVGLCVPSSCAEHEIRSLMETYLASDLFVGNALYDMNLQYDYAKDLKLTAATFRRTSFYLCCLFIATTIGLTIAAGMTRSPAAEENNNNTKDAVEEQEPSETTAEGITASEKLLLEKQQPIGVSSFIACYDIQANWQHIFKPSKAGHTFAALNGIRFYSAGCVTVYHYLMFLFNGTRNKWTLFNYQVHVGNVDVFVDIFFTISGFLQSYNHFRNVRMLEVIRRNNLKQNLVFIGLHIFHRCLRLAPLYFLTIGIADFGAQLIDEVSMYHSEHKMNVNCEKYWWRNVFFIQNFYDHNDMCGLWTWSLACDVQFAVLATVLLFLYVKDPKRTKLCLAALAVASVVYTYIYGLKLNFDGSLESTFVFLTEIYIHPLARILAYISGGIAGWFFVEQKHLPFTVGKKTQQFMSYLITLVFFGCIFKPPFQTLSPFTSTTILLLERIIFTLTCSILIVANAHGCMRWFFCLFETVLFQKFHRVVYAMFLLNPLITYALPGFSQSNLYANLLSMAAEFIGILVVLVIVATVFTLLFEIPYQNISRLLIIHQIKKKLS
uniref:Nose resistant to fluoxetine protein 6 n=1 Tax=Bactrocera dorsalis TaxID=27457 RepID=A0A034VG91_BACDO